MTTFFYVLVILPSMAFAFLVLSTFYGLKRAYFSICWIPVTLFLLLQMFQRLIAFDPSEGVWIEQLFTVTAWTSLVQCGLGVLLALRAFCRKQSFIGLFVAAWLSGLPFMLNA